jgi:hypothetical protein
MKKKTAKISEKNEVIQTEVVGPAGIGIGYNHLDSPIFGTQKELDDWIRKFRELNGVISNVSG